MEQLKDYLTNEAIKKRFDNQFDLVNYAIGVAKDMILAGRGPRIRTQTENPALQVLEEIVAGKDQFEPSAVKETPKVFEFVEIHSTLTKDDSMDEESGEESEEEEKEESIL